MNKAGTEETRNQKPDAGNRILPSMSLEDHFEPFRLNTIGRDQTFVSPFGERKVVYADWTASGRLYQPIEDRISEMIGPFVGNTHTESNVTGTSMTRAYREAQTIIKRHVNAGPSDIILTPGTGMTGAINKFQRILGLRVPDAMRHHIQLAEEHRPVVFITHMEHHSNQTSWLESIADVLVLPANDEGLVDVTLMRGMLERYKHRPLRIGSFTGCSNVTGICTPYHEMARIMHAYGGYCFIDFAASAPYVPIDMHPSDPEGKLDAVFFSPHKFLGGPGSSGILIFDKSLYHNRVPDNPGGGTVSWTNPWGGHSYIEDIELREDGGTPGFIQTIRAALAVRLKEQMGVDALLAREEELLHVAFDRLEKIEGVHMLAANVRDRLAILSFYLDDLHYNLAVKVLNDQYGIQVRGGCSCAGTYGHFLLHVDKAMSDRITERIDRGDLSIKPGWVRMSVHPIMTDAELTYILDAVEEVVRNKESWKEAYRYCSDSNEFVFKADDCSDGPDVSSWFDLPVTNPT